MSRAEAVRTALADRRDAMIETIASLARIESPSTEPDAIRPAVARIAGLFEDEGMACLTLPGRASAGALYAVPRDRPRGVCPQLILGHIDTVWPVGTLADMPVEQRDGTLVGPGTYDMKAGIVQALFALRVLSELDLEPSVPPVIFLNTDEEIGSRESTRHIRRLAAVSERAWVLEPSLGPTGRIKTARKGLGRFTITVHGRAAHAGLDPESGASAILELSHVIQRLFALNDPAAGVTVNVGTVDGGLRANVVAPISSCVVDARVPTHDDAARVEAAIRGLQPTTPGVRLQIEGGFGRPPMEKTEAGERLWQQARDAGRRLGLELDEATAGGGSDGNTTSQYTPTLDGLGAVGGGAHAPDEHVRIDAIVDRTALLALLLLLPSLEDR